MRIIIGVFISVILTGCQGADYHREKVSSDSINGISVGVVQREVKVGMSSAEVVAIAGSPNIVTTNQQGGEVWVYDKISTESAGSSSNTIGGFIFGSGSSGASSKSQRTLTVIVKFDGSGLVQDISYHSSRF